MKVWLAAGAGIVLIVIAALVLVPQISHFLPLLLPANPAGSGQVVPVSPAATPLTEATPIPVTSPPQTKLTTAVTPAPPPKTIPTTQLPTTTRTPSPTPTTAVPTTVPTAKPTSVITLAVTQVPPQPPSGSSTSSTPGAPYIDPFALEVRVHELINVKREQNGLSSLSYDSFLADIARGHSWDMVTRNYFEHENPEGLNARGRGDAAGYPCIRCIGHYTYEGIAENLFQGYRAEAYYTNAGGTIVSYNWSSLEDIAQVSVNGWMESPGHRKNILTEHFMQEGIGVSFSPDDKIYITENFC
jgi:uncharacterized protein YkwD